MFLFKFLNLKHCKSREIYIVWVFLSITIYFDHTQPTKLYHKFISIRNVNCRKYTKCIPPHFLFSRVLLTLIFIVTRYNLVYYKSIIN